jgi:O-antigen ligase
MNKGFQLVIAFVVFLAVSLSVAVSVGTGDYALPILIGTGALGVVLVATVGRTLPIDATIICLGIGGFYIAGKGFAYLNAGGILFVGEMLLALGGLGYLWRVGKGHFTLLPRSPMAWALFVLGTYALIRLPIDFRATGIMALRDACTIYYTLFFFIAYQLGQDDKVQRLAPVILIAMALPGMLLDFMLFAVPDIKGPLYSLTVRGNPLFLNHYDAIHPAAFGVALFFATKATHRQGINIFYFLAMFAVIAYLLGIGRGANYVAFAVMCVFLLVARQIHLLVGMAGGVIFLVCALLVLIEVNPSTGRQRLRQINDQIEVLVDPSKISGGKTTDADTADWRLQWWKKITRDVNATNPIFGLGFGYDIATDFHRQFFRTMTVDPDVARTRGAHNAFFTVLARMGWLGALFFVAVVIVQLTYFWRAAIAFRYGRIPPSQAFFWGSNLCAFVITFFQYAWEASYSAIPAWTCMGFSFAYLDKLRAADRAQVPAEPEEAPAPPKPLPFGRRPPGAVPVPRLSLSDNRPSAH